MRSEIMSIQSAVAYGHVGNSAAVFPLQRLGFEVWPINTVFFSNHTGYGVWRGFILEPEQVSDIIQGVRERGVIPRVGAVVSGYLGAAALGELLIETVREVRAARADALWACDPVMGDEGRGFFVRPGIPEFFRDRAVPAADIVTPNQFELSWLSGVEITDAEGTLEAAARVRASGPRTVVCTSLSYRGPDELGMLVDTEEGSWAVWTPRLPVDLNGTGDTFTALFLGNVLLGHAVAIALERTASSMFALVEATQRAGARELVLTAAQDQLADPPGLFKAERLR